jgi:uncharacterized protein (TIGR00251 family)
MLDLQLTSAGILLPVRAHPKARSNTITGIHNGRIKVSVTEAPEKGKANRGLVRVLAKCLALRKSQIALHSGETSSEKQFLIRDIEASELTRRIEALLSAN